MEKTEEQIHQECASYCEELKLEFHHNNNSGKSGRELAKLKKLGLQAGIPDIEINEPNATCHGLFLELKTNDGMLSPKQNIKLKRLNQRGYRAICCKGDEWRKEIDSYLNNLSVESDWSEDMNDIETHKFTHQTEDFIKNLIENFYVDFSNDCKDNPETNTKNKHNSRFNTRIAEPIVNMLWFCRDSCTALAYLYWVREINAYASDLYDVVCPMETIKNRYDVRQRIKYFWCDHSFIEHYKNRAKFVLVPLDVNELDLNGMEECIVPNESIEQIPELQQNLANDINCDIAELWRKVLVEINEQYPAYGAILTSARPSYKSTTNQIILTFPYSQRFAVKQMNCQIVADKISKIINDVSGLNYGFVTEVAEEEEKFDPIANIQGQPHPVVSEEDKQDMTEILSQFGAIDIKED